jgi:hypothetical protein
LANRRRRQNKAARKWNLSNPENAIVDNYNANKPLAAFISDEVNRFAEAVVNPFDDAAVGAILPDKWSSPTIPAMDIMSLNFAPSLYSKIDSTIVIYGMQFAFIPRSMGVGWAQDDGSGGTKNPIFYLNDAFGGHVKGRKTCANLYSIMVTCLGTTASITTPSFLCINPTTNAIVQGYNLFETNRYDEIISSCDGARIAGAGIKTIAQSAQIQTGGTVFGGWMTVDDLYKNVAQYAAGSVMTASSPFEVQTQLFGLSRFKGVDGCTVRYNPIQSSVQQKYRDLYPDTNLINNGNPHAEGFTDGSSVGAGDTIGPGDYIPSIVWNFNQTTEPNSDAYSIRFRMVVHLQCKPAGKCPFMINQVIYDTDFDQLCTILNNPTIFKIAVSGESFSSFMSAFGDVIKKSGQILKSGADFVTHAVAFGAGVLKILALVP